MDKEKAIAILKQSNLLLAQRMEELSGLLEHVQKETCPHDPYNTLEACRQEYEAVELAIEALQEKSGSPDPDLEASDECCTDLMDVIEAASARAGFEVLTRCRDALLVRRKAEDRDFRITVDSEPC